MIKLKAVRKQYELLFNKLCPEKNMKPIRYEKETLSEECQTKLSEKVIIFCPVCDYEQTSCYSTIRDFLCKNVNFCLNTECKYYCKGRTLGLFDIKKKCEKIGQIVLDKEYKNSHQLTHLKCIECGNERQIKLSSLTNGCINVLCKYNKLAWGEKTGDTIHQERHKTIDYEKLITSFNYKIIGNIPKIEEDKVTIECSKGHIIETNVFIFRNYTTNRKKVMCENCDIDEKYNYISNFAEKNNFYLDTKREECDDISSVKFLFRCKNDTTHTYKLKKLKINKLENLECSYCINSKIKLRTLSKNTLGKIGEDLPPTDEFMDIINLNNIYPNFPVFDIIAKKNEEVYVFSAKARLRYGINGKLNEIYNILTGENLSSKYKKALNLFTEMNYDINKIHYCFLVCPLEENKPCIYYWGKFTDINPLCIKDNIINDKINYFGIPVKDEQLKNYKIFGQQEWNYIEKKYLN